MYDANASYEENYRNGPDARFVKGARFPRIRFVGEPQFSFLGVPLHIPFGIPAGPLLHSGYMQAALDAGFCLPTYKTVRSRAYSSHPFPNVLKLTSDAAQLHVAEGLRRVGATRLGTSDYESSALSISNSFGVPSQSPDVWSADFMRVTPTAGQSAVLSFQGTRENGAGLDGFADDAAETAVLAAETVTAAGGSLLEINLSCPNESGAPIYTDRNAAAAVLRQVHSALKKFPSVKLIAKVGPLPTETETELFLKAVFPYVHALSAINTVPARILDESGKAALGSGTEVGGVCGALILEQGLMTIGALSKARRKLGFGSSELSLIGVGGVFGIKDFFAYRDAGADVVQAATGAMWNLNLAQDVARACGIHFEEFR